MKVPVLDPRFGKLVALMKSTTHEGERRSAEAKATAIASAAGLTFERAMAIKTYNAVRSAQPNNPFAGFDEYQEIDNPGHLARRTAERADKRRKWAEKRAALVEQYGSLEAVLKPCDRERLILAAVKPWRTPQKPPHQRWTSKLDGWDSLTLVEKMAPELRAAIEGAYPMPKSFSEACKELAYWQARDTDMEHALDDSGTGLGDTGLDRAAYARMELVRELVEHEIRLTTLTEVMERFRIYRGREIDEPKIEAALFRDLEALVESADAALGGTP